MPGQPIAGAERLAVPTDDIRPPHLDPGEDVADNSPSRSGEPVWKRSWRATAPWVSGLLTLATVVLVVCHFGTLEQFTRLTLLVEPRWFLLALGTQALTYLCASLAWQRTLSRAGYWRPLSILVPLGIAKLFTDQVVPSSGVSGAILVTTALRRRRIPTHAAMDVLLVGLVSYFAAYLMVVLSALLVLTVHHRANAAMFLAAAVFLAMVIAIPSGVLWMKKWGSELPLRWVRRFPGVDHLLQAITDAPADLLRDPLLLAQTIPLEATIFCLDALTLWLVLRGLGQDPDTWIVFASFVMASMTATLAPIPLGLGSFEAACVGMLHLLGTSVESALAATLLLRGLTFWLPMLPGLWLARREIVAGSGS